MTNDPGSEPRGWRLLLATDGSDHANEALAAGLRLVHPASHSLLVTVVPDLDPSIVVGSGHAGPVMAYADKQQLLEERNREARRALDRTIEYLGIGDIDTEILAGDPGSEVCARAASGDVDLIVIGTSGVGGLKRALLGSVSDHVVRNAPCPVMTVGPN